MKNNSQELKPNEIPLSLNQFLESFNQNMPANFPQVSEEQLIKFRKEHETLFQKTGTWSLDQHRKKVMDWLPGNLDEA
jgi:hypothetical protein